ncbi:hypothetical protein [uncultured Prevotella sp.]|jgi:hypothetical protein|uniref:hypothetical protein n=1 Tax=uncultured Prevotella sp. TaxID=159272 RepID=UPI002618D2AD|nr:hypothetical protein [uncultured Prevotella sp.]
MKKTISNYRYYVLVVLAFVCFIGIFAVPDDGLPFISWLWILISSKIAGFGAGCLFYNLVDHWRGRKSIPELTSFIDNF